MHRCTSLLSDSKYRLLNKSSGLFWNIKISRKMENSSLFELSSVVQKELSTFNDVKGLISLEGVDVLMQTICDGFTKIPSSNQSDDTLKKLEGKFYC